MLKFLYRILCGFFLGISTLAPGISGSIVAIIIGVYHDILDVISSPFKDLRKSVLLLVPVGIGVGISIVFFVFMFSIIFQTHEKAAYLLFAGLIIGNIPIVIKQIRETNFKILHLLYGFIAFALTYALGLISFGGGQSLSVDAVTSSLFIIAISGFAAGAALLVPGISFSMILILTGAYGQLIYATLSVVQGNFSYLVLILIFGIMVIAGLALASKLIKAAFAKYPGAANTSVLGFMLGSFAILLVQGIKVVQPGFIWWHGVLAALIGLGISIMFIVLLKFINKGKNGKNTKESKDKSAKEKK